MGTHIFPNVKGANGNSMPVEINGPTPDYATNTWIWPSVFDTTFYSAVLSASIGAGDATFRTFLNTTKPGSSYKWGDFDESGAFNSSDAAKIVYYATGYRDSTVTPIAARNISELVWYLHTNYASVGLTASPLESTTGPQRNSLYGSKLYVDKIYTNSVNNGLDWTPAEYNPSSLIGMGIVKGTDAPATIRLYGNDAWTMAEDIGTGRYKFHTNNAYIIPNSTSSCNIQATCTWQLNSSTTNHNLMGVEIALITSSSFEVWGKYGPSTTMYDMERVWVMVTRNDKAGQEYIY